MYKNKNTLFDIIIVVIVIIFLILGLLITINVGLATITNVKEFFIGQVDNIEETIVKTPILKARKLETISIIENIEPDKELTEKEQIYIFIDEVCDNYPLVNSELIKSIIHHESSYDSTAVNYDGSCVGLMQISTYWHRERAEKLEVTDFFDPYSNILLGVDYLSELFSIYEHPELVLMLYNGNHDTAKNRFETGNISNYAISVLEMSNNLEGG